jgi:hypothetical protein
MTLQVNMEDGLSLESYLVGYVHHALNDIAECLNDNDVNKAIRKTYEAIECLKQRLQFNAIEKACEAT